MWHLICRLSVLMCARSHRGAAGCHGSFDADPVKSRECAAVRISIHYRCSQCNDRWNACSKQIVLSRIITVVSNHYSWYGIPCTDNASPKLQNDQATNGQVYRPNYVEKHVNGLCQPTEKQLCAPSHFWSPSGLLMITEQGVVLRDPGLPFTCNLWMS